MRNDGGSDNEINMQIKMHGRKLPLRSRKHTRLAFLLLFLFEAVSLFYFCLLFFFPLTTRLLILALATDGRVGLRKNVLVVDSRRVAMETTIYRVVRRKACRLVFNFERGHRSG